MKKIICCILIIHFLFNLTACSQNTSKDSPIFYYPRINYLYNDFSGVIGEEKPELLQHTTSAEELIQEYLKGPKDPLLHFPLADRVKLVDMHSDDGDTLQLTFDDTIAALAPTELSASLAALAMTCFEISNAEEIRIRGENVMLDGQQMIIFTRNNILLWDNCIDDLPATHSTESGE